MAQATGSREYLAYVAEVTPGTTPATPALVSIPQVSNSLNMSRGLISDPSLRSDRMKRFSRNGNRAVGGNISVAYAPTTYDDLTAMAFMGAWTTNVLKIGTLTPTATFEIGHVDVGQYRSFNGVACGGMTLNVPSGNSLVTAEYEMMGMNGDVTTASLDGNGVAPASEDAPFVHLDATITEGGSSIGYLTGLQVKIENSLTTNYALGSAGARSITAGMSIVTGQVTAYFESAALFTKWVNETATSLQFVLNSGTDSQTWLMPNVKYTASTVPTSGDGPIIQTLTFEALYDAGIGSTIQVTRTV